MATLTGKEDTLFETLNNLLDHDAEAHQAAIDQLDDFAIKEQITLSMDDHQRPSEELGEIERDLEGAPPKR